MIIMKTIRITAAQIAAGRSAKGGWSQNLLASWGVPWPPPKGWQRMLLEGDFHPEPWTKPVPLRKEIFQKGLKLNPTKPEVVMHGALLQAFDPYRAMVKFQEIIPPYIADFYIYPCNIVVEIDGKYHETAQQRESDRRRDTFMRNKGIKVFRFSNDDAMQNSKQIAEMILQECGNLRLKSEPVTVTRCPPGSAI